MASKPPAHRPNLYAPLARPACRRGGSTADLQRPPPGLRSLRAPATVNETETTASPLGGDTIARNTGFALAAQAITATFTAGLTIFLVRALAPHSYGIFALALAVGALALQPSDFGISQSAARFIAERRAERGAVAAILADALRLKLIAGIAVLAALVALAHPIASA